MDTNFLESLLVSLEAFGNRQFGQPLTAIRAVSGGYTEAKRLLVTSRSGSTFFVKASTSALTAQWLQQEIRVYEALAGEAFLPCFHRSDFYDTAEGAYPFLVLEDLSQAQWPPPWTPGRIATVQSSLDALHAWRGPEWEHFASAKEELTDNWGWAVVRHDSAPFLNLGFCSPSWLSSALPVLEAAEQAAPFEGNSLLHLDIRSDNICFRADGSAVFVDWNWASRGNPTLDLACWLPSLHDEGGPAPEALLPNAPEFAACLAGYWAARAGLPPPPTAAFSLRALQKRLLSIALPWAARTLDLPPPT